MLRPLACLILALLCACATAPPSEKKKSAPAQVNLAGFPLAFKEGYAEGCQSAKAGKRQRNEARYKKDTQYASGWRDGFDICRPR